MGAGKTTIGRLIAKQTGFTFYDSDHEVEKKTGVKIPLIFELEGEAGFRKRESAMIAELSELKNIVMATGGGAILLPENRACLKSHGSIIYLRGQVEDLWIRTRHDKSRPLLQGVNMREKLTQLYQVRDPIYLELADYVVNTGSQSAQEITDEIMTLLELNKSDTGSTK
jgi:shikimate kinase